MFLILLITSSVSFTYSSSEAANAGAAAAAGRRRTVAERVRNWRRPGGAAAEMVVVGGVSLDLVVMSGRGFGVEVVGVIRVGEAIVCCVCKRESVGVFRRGRWKWGFA